MKPIILDVEASGLHPDSYPIQIGWVELGGDAFDSFYIRPHESWTYWSVLAEDVHGISLETLEKKGLPPEEACARLIQRLGDRSIYTDQPAFDGFWLDRLFEAVADESEPLECRHVSLLSGPGDPGRLSALLAEIRFHHDALDDARQIAKAVLDIQTTGAT